jgi:hypothetical protein
MELTMFARETTDWLTFKEEKDGVKVERGVQIRKLSWRSLDAAEEARNLTRVSSMKNLGTDIIKMFSSTNVEKLAEQVRDEAKKEAELTIEERREARYNSYDQATVLRAGIVKFTDESRNGKALEESVGDLDFDTARRCFRAIIDMSTPPLEKAEAEEIPKEGTEASISG